MGTLKELINKNDTDGIIAYMQVNNLVVKDGKIVPANADSKKNIEKQRDFFDQRQLIKKILLNS